MGIAELVSHTTRSPRAGEVDGEHYNFVGNDTFNKDEMIEYTEYNGYFYGLHEQEVSQKLREHTYVYAAVDRAGARQFKEKFGKIVVTIFIYAPRHLLPKRMRERGDSEEIILDRLKYMYVTNEMGNIDIADYCVVNIDWDKSVSLLSFIAKNEIQATRPIEH